MASNADATDKELVSAATHGLDFALDDLLHVSVALRLHQVLALGHPGAAAALLLGLFDHNGRLDGDHVHQLVEPEELIARLHQEVVDVHLRVLTVIVQENECRVARMEERAIGSGNGLVDDVVADVVLEKTVLGDGLF